MKFLKLFTKSIMCLFNNYEIQVSVVGPQKMV